MTQVTPPGWYPDPGQTSDAPAAERWWDGEAWTDQVRPAGQAGAWGPPAHPPGFGPYPQAGPAPRRRGLRTGIAVAAAVAVLAAIGGGVYALTADDGGAGGSASRTPGGQGGRGGPEGQGGSGGDGGSRGRGGSGGPGEQPPAPGESGRPRTEAGYATDLYNGISIPVPDGWTGRDGPATAAVSTKDTYACPGDTAQKCQRGGAYSAPAKLQGLTAKTPRAAAEQDISKNAAESYGKGYGSITSHEELASKAVTVAGRKGYMVRWKVVTSKGADGYVESLVFPSPASSSLVVVRFGVDVGARSPGLKAIDTITKGIKAASGAGGNGQNV